MKLFSKLETGYRYIIVGILNTVVGFSFFPVFYYTLKNYLGPNCLITLSYICCLIFGFITHKYLTFNSRDNTGKQTIKFVASQIILWLFNLLIINLILKYYNLDVFILQNILTLLITFLNYFILRKIIFN